MRPSRSRMQFVLEKSTLPIISGKEQIDIPVGILTAEIFEHRKASLE